MSRVATIDELHVPVDYGTPQIQVRLDRPAWNKLCNFLAIVPFPILERNFAPEDEVGILVLREEATGKIPDVLDYIRDMDAAPVWYSPFEHDPESCKECGNEEARPYPEHLDSIFCQGCARTAQLRKDAMVEQFHWVQRWFAKGLEFGDLSSIALGGVSAIASALNVQPDELEA